jgi:hypothetical protein
MSMVFKGIHHQLSTGGITKMFSNSVVKVNHCCVSKPKRSKIGL